MKEVWKDVVGYEGLYQVSNLGRVKSLRKKVIRRNVLCNQNERILHSAIDGGGYCKIKLYKNGRKKQFAVHRLVAIAFIPNPLNLPQINHKDENKKNNTVFLNPDGSVNIGKTNLEWCTASYNVNYGTAKQRGIETSNRRGNVHAEIPVNQFDLKGNFIKRFRSAHHAARELHLHVSGIRSCCIGKRNKCGGFIFLKDEDVDKIQKKIKEKKQGKKVAQYDENHNLIKIWDNGIEACKAVGLSSGYLSLCCRGVYKKGKGFIWKFV